MGIIGFNKLIDTISKTQFSHIISAIPPSNVSTLLLDANSLLYKAFDIVFYDKFEDPLHISYEEWKEEIINAFINLLNDLIKNHNPSNMVIVSLDGVAPDAKIKKQRSARYSVSIKRQEIKEREIKNDESERFLVNFHTDEFSPGTAFMKSFISEVTKYLESYEVVNKVQAVLLSSYLELGEGEHKIMQLFRERKIIETGTHVIVGNDSDLIVLASMQNYEGIYVHQLPKSAKDYRGRWVSVDVFKYYLNEIMLFKKNPALEFSVLVCFMGNDFIPTPFMFMMGDKEYVPIMTLIDAYTTINMSLIKEFKGNVFYPSIDGIKSLVNYCQSIEKPTLTRVISNRKSDMFDESFQRVEYQEKQLKTNSSYEFKENGYEILLQNWRNMEYEWKQAREHKDIDSTNSEIDAKNLSLTLARQFFEGIYWTWFYYTDNKRGENVVNMKWVYNGYFCPLMVDLKSVIDKYTHADFISKVVDPNVMANSIDFMSIPQQLYCIIPPDYRHNSIPQKIGELIPKPPKDGYEAETLGLGNESHHIVYNFDIITRNKKGMLNGVNQQDNNTLITMSKSSEYIPKKADLFIVNPSQLELYKQQEEINQNKIKISQKVVKKEAPTITSRSFGR